MADTTQKTATADPKAAPPAGEAPAAAGGKKGLLWIVLGGVGLVAVIVVAVVLMGGKDHKEGEGNGGGGSGSGARELKPEDAIPGKQVKIPDMVFPMSSEREKDFMAFQLSVVLVLRKPARLDDEEVMKRQLEIEDAVEKHVPWIQQEISNMVFRYPMEERDRLLQDVGAQQFAEELKGIVNKKFKQFGVDVVKDVWVPIRRPVTQ